MAIANTDGVIGGYQAPIYFEKIGVTMEAAGVLHSTLYMAGYPGAGVAPTSAIAGDALTSYPGQIPFDNPVSGNAYLGRFSPLTSQTARVFLADRLWHNANISSTTTTAQTVNSTTLPARDSAGSTSGAGILVALEVSTVTGNVSAITNMTLSYTNSAGTSGRTGTIASFPATAIAGTFIPFQLQAGDVGVRSIQSVTLGTSLVSGVVHLVAYRVFADSPILVGNVGEVSDVWKLGMPRLYNNTVPFLLIQPTTTSATSVRAMLSYTHG